MIDLERFSSSIKFTVYSIVPKSGWLYFSSIFQLPISCFWWFSWHTFSKLKSLPENFTWVRTFDLLWSFFLSVRILHFYFLQLNLTTRASFLKDGSSLERRLVWTCDQLERERERERKSDLQTYSSSSLIDAVTQHNFTELQQLYCALFTTFHNNWNILPLNT